MLVGMTNLILGAVIFTVALYHPDSKWAIGVGLFQMFVGACGAIIDTIRSQ